MRWTVRYTNEPATNAPDIDANTPRDAAAKRLALDYTANHPDDTETRTLCVRPADSDDEDWECFTADIHIEPVTAAEKA